MAQNLEKQRFELERRQEEREEAEREERRQIRLQQERRDARADWDSQWKQAMQLCESAIDQLRARGLQLLDKLDKEKEEAQATGRW